MNYFPKSELIKGPNRHWASEPHLRIQVLTITADSSTEFFDQYHGELLVIVLDGKANIRTPEKSLEVSNGDEVLFIDGEKFNILPAAEHGSVKIQYIWAPGPNPCKFCWDISNRFYGNVAT